MVIACKFCNLSDISGDKTNSQYIHKCLYKQDQNMFAPMQFLLFTYSYN